MFREIRTIIANIFIAEVMILLAVILASIQFTVEARTLPVVLTMGVCYYLLVSLLSEIQCQHILIRSISPVADNPLLRVCAPHRALLPQLQKGAAGPNAHGAQARTGSAVRVSRNKKVIV